ncbi:MAG: hypothetical protein AB7V62_01155 [Thermoleophilia bacterium]
MRRVLTAIAALGIVGALAVPAGSQAPGAKLRIQPNAVKVVTPAEDAADRETVFVARAGTQYRFEVGYRVSGAKKIGTGHVFVIENAVTGERLEVLSKSFPPEDPGVYTESSNYTIPADWAPGVYRFKWTLNARHPRLDSVQATGSRVFLVAGPQG